MREVHRELQELKGIADPLDELGKRMAQRFRLICFDEFHVADITDAMILSPPAGRVVRQRRVHRHHVNFHPGRPSIRNGLHRDRILPGHRTAGAQLTSSTSTTAPTTGAVRWSRSASTTAPGPNGGCRADEAFRRPGRGPRRRSTPHIEAPRDLRSRRAGRVVWFDFATLCGGPRSQNDYLEIARQFHTVMSDVPRCRCAWPVRRDASPGWWTCSEQLYTEGPLAHEFPRTVSRLVEMQFRRLPVPSPAARWTRARHEAAGVGLGYRRRDRCG